MKTLLDNIEQAIPVILDAIIQIKDKIVNPLRLSIRNLLFNSIDDITIAFWPICGLGVVIAIAIAVIKYIINKWF